VRPGSAKVRREEAEAGRCGLCRHFQGGAAALEAMFPGLKSLSSGYASVTADDGLCLVHDRHVAATGGCPSFAPRDL
jgi:hypothetical protein